MADKTLVQVFTQKREFKLYGGKIVRFEQTYKGHSEVNVDFVAIDECFSDDDVYDVRRFETGNKTSDEVKLWFSNLAEGKGPVKATDYGTFIFVFLTTLTSDDCLLIGKDDTLGLEDIFDKIKTSSFMAGKTKIFIVQADDETIVKKIEEQQPQDKTKRKLPQDADRLVIISTLPQVLSNLNLDELPKPDLPYYEIFKSEGMTQCVVPKTGNNTSPLIQAFVRVMKDNRSEDKKLDLLSLTPVINGRLKEMLLPFKQRFENIHFPIPLVTSTLTQSVWLK